MSLLDILQTELNLFLAAVTLVLLLPFSSHHKVRYYGCFIVYIFLMCLSAVFFVPVFLFRPKDVRNSALAGEILKHISKLIGVQWELRGGPILEVERGAVVVANHQSMIDILGALGIWKVMGKCSMVAKRLVFYVWPFGLASWLAGIVFIDRDLKSSSTSARYNQLEEAARLICKEKTKIWIYPEGTRNKNPDAMLPFKKGAFRLAVVCQAPIIPVVYSPYYFLDSEKKIFGKGKVVMQCLDPVPTEGKAEKDIDSLIQEVRTKMIKQYDLLKQEVLAHKEACATLIH